MADIKRWRRVAELLRHEINHIMSRDLKDPLVGMVNVSQVMLSKDLKFAKIYVSILGKESSVEDSINGLTRAKNFIRSELGHRLDLRSIPELIFVHDDSVRYAQSIEVLLEKIHREAS